MIELLLSALDEMRMLQKKLEETEAQMCRILNAMQSVHSKVDRVNVPENSEQPKVTFSFRQPKILVSVLPLSLEDR